MLLPTLTARERVLLRVQRLMSLLCFPVVGLIALTWLKVTMRLKLADAHGVRARFRELMANDSRPVLLCVNHLTLVDSIILSWALMPIGEYLRKYSWFPWNVPERTNFSRGVFWRVTSFLGKCVFVTRGGPREEVKRTLAKIANLLQSGELVVIFPEGGRSRTGRVDTENFAYGVGRIIQSVPEIRVLCVYMRGSMQEGHSDFPIKGDTYTVDLEMLQPNTSFTGLRGARDLATQIIGRLAEMEVRYFDRKRSG